MTFETILRTGSNCHGVVVELSCVGGVQSHVCLKMWCIRWHRGHSHVTAEVTDLFLQLQYGAIVALQFPLYETEIGQLSECSIAIL